MISGPKYSFSDIKKSPVQWLDAGLQLNTTKTRETQLRVHYTQSNTPGVGVYKINHAAEMDMEIL